jgi:DNA-binding response OmpR family regulator
MAERLEDLPGCGKQLVLLVDDDHAVRDMVTDVLRDAGYHVIDAASGEGALRRLERITRPAVLVTDVRLGAGMSGIELAAIVRKLWPMTGILLVSGDTLPDSQVAAAEFLAKPFTTDGILERVAAITPRMQPAFQPSLN